MISISLEKINATTRMNDSSALERSRSYFTHTHLEVHMGCECSWKSGFEIMGAEDLLAALQVVVAQPEWKIQRVILNGCRSSSLCSAGRNLLLPPDSNATKNLVNLQYILYSLLYLFRGF
jgi:hypothetical protein